MVERLRVVDPASAFVAFIDASHTLLVLLRARTVA